MGETEALRGHRASLERCSTAPAPRSPCDPVALTFPRPRIWTISMSRLCLPHKHPPTEPSAWAAPDVTGSMPGALLECWGTQSHWTRRGKTEAHAGHRQSKDMDYAVARLRSGDRELRLYRKDSRARQKGSTCTRTHKLARAHTQAPVLVRKVTPRIPDTLGMAME